MPAQLYLRNIQSKPQPDLLDSVSIGYGINFVVPFGIRR